MELGIQSIAFSLCVFAASFAACKARNGSTVKATSPTDSSESDADIPSLVPAMSSSSSSGSEGDSSADSSASSSSSSGLDRGPQNCPRGYVPVPGDPVFGTRGFCVMKYEAKRGNSGAISTPEGMPDTSVEWNLAFERCKKNGSNFHLITNNEWLTVGANIASVRENWSNGRLNIGRFTPNVGDFLGMEASADDNRSCFKTEGEAAGQRCDANTWNIFRRTLRLANGALIWDISGNVWEWVNYEKARDPFDRAPKKSTHPFWNDSWNENNGIGRFDNHPAQGPIVKRGGDMSNGETAGVFAVIYDNQIVFPDSDTGYRCVFTP